MNADGHHLAGVLSITLDDGAEADSGRTQLERNGTQVHLVVRHERDSVAVLGHRS